MNDTIITFAGRNFTSEDIELIKWARQTYQSLPRGELASTVCEFLDWTTPAGRPKTPQCLLLLQKLETEGIIQLPEPKRSRIRKVSTKTQHMEFDTTPICGELSEYEPIYLEIVTSGQPSFARWKAYLDQYHMLGYKQEFGSRLHYFIKSGDKELGCLEFSASAWALEHRDRWIGWSIQDKKERLHLIINNSRFLILPWAHIQNLASKVLSIAARQIQSDWLKWYCYAPVLLETFVDLEHFAGTCYKAANWLYLGQTKGRGRMDKNKEYPLSRKAIYVYPLEKDFMTYLRGERPYRRINPDEE
ncbi:MAG: hypothetical protein PWP48_561 [Clostridiales bacterium]|nr:hypothetical protein [Clostridiales bacterium]